MCPTGSYAPVYKQTLSTLTMNFMFPVPDASVPAREICKKNE